MDQDPIKELYANLVNGGLIKDTSEADFVAGLQDPVKQRKLYDSLSSIPVPGVEHGAASLPWDEFNSRFFKKKSPSGIPSQDGSSQPPAPAQPAVAPSGSDPFLPGIQVKNDPPAKPAAPTVPPERMMVDAMPIDNTGMAPIVDRGPAVAYGITGDEDIAQYAAARPASAVKENTAAGAQTMATKFAPGDTAKHALLYGEDAKRQASLAVTRLDQQFGPDWRNSAEAKQSPDYDAFLSATKAQARAFDTFNAETGGYELTGSEDPVAFGEQRRKNLPSYSYKKAYSEKTPARMEWRKLDNIVEYGDAAKAQERVSDQILAQKYGPSWQHDMANLVMSDPDLMDPASIQRYNEVISDPDFIRWQGALRAQNNGFNKFKEAVDSSPALKAQMADAAKAKARSEVAGKVNPMPEALGFLMPAGAPDVGNMSANWFARKGAKLLGAAMSLPRTIGKAFTSEDGQWRVADELGSMADELVSAAEIRYPKPEDRSGPLYKRVAEFEGKRINVDANGNPVNHPADLPEGFIQRFKESNAGKDAKTVFSGGIALSDKVIDSAADLIIYRVVGGGAKIGTALSSFYMNHHDAYREAVDQQKMGADDAAQYAFVTSLMQGALEAYVGDIETKLGTPSVAKAIEIGRKEALAVAGKSTAAERAKIALTPVIKEIVGENKEEVLQAVQDAATRAYYNTATGAQLDINMSKDDIKETILTTTLLTAPLAALGMSGYTDSYRRSATLAAARNPERFAKIMDDLSTEGAIDRQTAISMTEKVKKLSDYNLNLPDGITDDQRSHILSVSLYRNDQEQIAKNENFTPAQQAMARSEVKTADEVVSSIVKDATTAIPEPKQEEAPKTEQKPIQIEGLDPTVKVGEIPSTDSNIDTKSERDVATSTAIQTTISGIVERMTGVPMTGKELDLLSQEVSDQFMNRASMYDPEESVSDAVVRISDEIVAQRKQPIEAPIESVVDHFNAFLYDGGKVSSSTPVNNTSSEYYSESGDTIQEIAARAAAATGTTPAQAEAEIKAYMSDTPDPEPGRHLKMKEAMAAGLTKSEAEISISNEPRVAKAIEDSLDPEDQAALEDFLADETPDTIIAMVDGVAEEMTQAKFDQLAKTNPRIHKLINDEVSNEVVDGGNKEVVDGGEKTSAAPTKDPIKQAQGGSRPGDGQGNQGAGDKQPDNVGYSPEAPIDAVESMVATPDVAIKAMSGDEKAQGSISIPPAVADMEASIDIADAIEASDMADSNLETDIPAPIVVYTDKHVIIQAPGAEDALRQAGGVYHPGKGFVFPLAKKDRALLAASRSRKVRAEKVSKANSGRVQVAMSDRKIAKTSASITAEISSGPSTKSRLEIAKEALHVKDGERKARVEKVVNSLRSSFPGIEVIMDPAEVSAALGTANIADVSGFVKDGKVYINIDNAGVDTAMHEFGHIWAELLFAQKPALYESAVASIKGSEYEAAVREDTRYSGLSDEEVIKEALALAIGERGARFMDEGPWGVFKAILVKVKKAVKTIMGFDPMKMTAYELADYMAARMATGEQISSEESASVEALSSGMKHMFFGEDLSPAKQDLESAKKMEVIGHTPREIWASTNWFRGVDGLWRWEANDTMNVFVRPETVESGTAMELKDVVSHELLFQVFPDIKRMPVLFYSDPEGNAAASICQSDFGIYMAINTAFSKNFEQVLLHELQHVVQLKEGFSVGANSDVNELSALMADNAAVAMIRGDRDRYERILNASGRAARELYFRLSGEVEARTVSRRFNDRHLATMDDTDVAPEEQIVLFGKGSPSMSIKGFEDTDVSPMARFQYGSSALRQRSIESAAKTLIDIEVKQGNEDPDSFVPLIANELGLDEALVREMYDDARAIYAKNRQWLDLRNGMIPTTIAAMKAKWRRRWDRWVGPNKGLPPGVFVEAQRIDREVSAMMYEAGKLGDALQKALKAYGAGPEMRELVQSAMEGNAEWSAVPVEIAVPAQAVRSAIDRLSRGLLLSGAVKKGTIVTIMENMGVEISDPLAVESMEEILSKPPYERTDEENMEVDKFLADHQVRFGTYLNRSYRAHVYEDWASRVSPEVVARARRYFVKRFKDEYDALVKAMSTSEAKAEKKKEALRKVVESSLSLADAIIKKEVPVDGETEQDFHDRILHVKSAVDEIAAMAGVDTSTFNTLVLPQEESDLAAIMYEARQAAGEISKIDEAIERKRKATGEKLDFVSGRLNDVDGEIAGILHRQSPDHSFASAAIGGAKNLSVFMRRQDIAPEIRELLGEYRDPVANFAVSAMRMSNLLATQEFLNTMASRYKGIYFFNSTDKPPGNYVKVSGENNPRLSPLDGWWTSPEILESLQDMREPQSMGPLEKFWAMQFVQRVKLGKTILSPVTHARNFTGNTAFVLLNGWNPFKVWTKWKELGLSSNTAQWQSYAKRLHQLGVFGESVNAGDIEAIRKFSAFEAGNDEIAGYAKFVAKYLVMPAKSIFRATKFAYEVEDNFYRMMAFENEKDRYAAAWYQKPFRELTREESDAVESRAAYIVSHVMPTYSYVGKLVGAIRRIPMIGTFIAFPSEMFRVAYNNFQLAFEEMRDTRTAGIGMKRLAGAIAVHSMEWGIIAAAKAAFGYDDEEWTDANKFVSPFERNGALVPLPKTDEGMMSYINLSYTNPYGFVGKMARAWSEDPDAPIAGKVASSIYQAADPFVSPELSFSAFMHLFMNQDDWGRRLRSSAFEDDAFGTNWLAKENVGRQFEYMAKKLQPGLVKSVRDAYDIYHKNVSKSGKANTWTNYALSHLLGLSIQKIDPTFSYASQMFGLYDQKVDAKKAYTTLQKQLNRAFVTMEKDLSPEELKSKDKEATKRLKEQYTVAKEAYRRILSDAHELTMALRRLGVNQSAIEKSMGESWTRREKEAILSGKIEIPLTFERKGRY